MLLLLCVDGQCPLDIDFDVCNSTDFGKCQLFITYKYVAGDGRFQLDLCKHSNLLFYRRYHRGTLFTVNFILT